MLTKYSFKGIKKSEAESIRDEMRITRGDVVTDHLLVRINNIITRYYGGKGFLDTEVKITQIADTTKANNVILEIAVDKKSTIKQLTTAFFGNKPGSATATPSWFSSESE